MTILLKPRSIIIILFSMSLVVWCSCTGHSNLYYIEDADMYIRTFPSRESVIIAFSDKRINKFSDTLNYVKVHKGDDYGTNFLFDPNKKKMIYDSGCNGIIKVHMVNYELGEVLCRDTTYYEYMREGGYLLKAPYVEISFYLRGVTEELSSKNRNNIYFTEIKPIK